MPGVARCCPVRQRRKDEPIYRRLATIHERHRRQTDDRPVAIPTHWLTAMSRQKLMRLLWATFSGESIGAIRHFARFVLSEIWGNATLAEYGTVVIIT